LLASWAETRCSAQPYENELLDPRQGKSSGTAPSLLQQLSLISSIFLTPPCCSSSCRAPKLD
jgi:hypothetical protein